VKYPAHIHSKSHHKDLKEGKKIKYGVWKRDLSSSIIRCNVLVSGIDPAVSLCVISDELVMRSEGSGYLLPSTPSSSPVSYLPTAQSLSKFQVSSTVFLQGIILCLFLAMIWLQKLLHGGSVCTSVSYCNSECVTCVKHWTKPPVSQLQKSDNVKINF